MDDELSFNEVISGTLGVFRENVVPIAIFVGVMVAIGSGIELGLVGLFDDSFLSESNFSQIQELIGFGAGLIGFLVFVIAVVAQYLLWEALLKQAGYSEGLGRHRYFAFIGQSILIALGTGLGYLLLIVPGLIVTARWAMAPGLMIGEGQGAIDAMGNSWEAVRGNSTPIVLAILAAVLLFVLASVAVNGFDIFSENVVGVSPFASVGSNILSNLGSALAICLGVFLMSHFMSSSEKLGEVFD